jgi:hypothetical protein
MGTHHFGWGVTLGNTTFPVGWLLLGPQFGSIAVRTDELVHSFTEVTAMARLARAEVFDPTEVAVLHICARVVRRCYLFGGDPVTGTNHDHRKNWIEDQLKLLATHLGIDSEVARRWLMVCPIRKKNDRSAEEPNEFELNSIRNDPVKLATIRKRLRRRSTRSCRR